MVTNLIARISEKKRRSSPSTLFKGDDKLFKQAFSEGLVYGEYGCGQSTDWVINNTVAKVLAVDTSVTWVEKVLSNSPVENQRLNIKHIDLGKTLDWGYPIDYQYSDNFSQYTDWIWQQTEKPNIVLIDGRFRVCCFLTSLKYAEEGTRIFFDDYLDRPHYHCVEKYVRRAAECGRQCMFIVPAAKQIDYLALEQDIANFRYVMD